ncbi:MAG: DNA/RNA non-specific endonuclease [Brumimicrobium sp.]
MNYFLLFASFVAILFFTPLKAQSELSLKQKELKELQNREEKLLSEIEDLKLALVIKQIDSVGLPESKEDLQVVKYSGYTIGFNPKYKMAAWAFHQLLPDINFGNQSRTNDFRVDSTIIGGTAVEKDYFLKETVNGETTYDGFGYDRGHLAPSADFRWSGKALSESYYYSNMTPQHPDFNREIWVELESMLRTINEHSPNRYYIITGPVLSDTLPEIERSVNKLKIPALHYKIITDLSKDDPKGMAFLIPNRKCEYPLESYLVSIDSIESLAGLDFFPKLNDELESKIESKSNFKSWRISDIENSDVAPIHPPDLPRNHFNTVQAKMHEGSKITVIGKVVSTKYIPKSNSTFLNLDKSFPDHIFSVNIWSDGRKNFSYKPEEELEGLYIAVTGKVSIDKYGIANITVDNERQIEVLGDDWRR